MKSTLRENGSRHSTHPNQFVREKGRRSPIRDGIDTLINTSPLMAAQRKKLQSLFGTAAQLQEEPAQKSNHTGLPDHLKAGIESLSGLSMDHVQVHYNSSKPAQLNALAYAQGSDIHLAPGQEQRLPHEVWHVVQQSQGRVRPTMQMAGGVAVNDDKALERGADVMGARAHGKAPQAPEKNWGGTTGLSAPIQRVRVGLLYDTTVPEHRKFVLDHLRTIGPDEMMDFRNQMVRENHPNNKEYIQICNMELGRIGVLDRITNQSVNSGGIWSSATIFCEKQHCFTTEPQRSGMEHDDEYGGNNIQDPDERRLSQRDSEVATLTLLGEKLELLLPHCAPGLRVEVYFIGNMGPCNGCKDRLRVFFEEYCQKFNARGVNFSMEINYTTGPHDVFRGGDVHTTYGYQGDRNHHVPGKGDYFHHTLR